MKKFVLPLLMLLLSVSGLLAQITVTYKVDVTDYVNAGNALGPNGIRIGGNFGDQGATNGSTAMPNWTPSNPACGLIDLGNNVWAISVTYPSSSAGATQLYKFVNNDWGTNEGLGGSTIESGGCGVNDGGGNINRTLVIPSANTEICFIWDACTNCSAAPELPVVNTDPVSNVVINTATVKGSISGVGINVRGFCYSTNPNPGFADFVVNAGQGSGVFTTGLTGLNPSTTYYVCAFAINAAGPSFGNVVSFTTFSQADFPVISTDAISGVTDMSAVSGGNVSSSGTTPVTARGVCWSLSPNPTVNLLTKTVDGSGTGTFTSNIDNLGPGLTFHVRAYATNSAGTVYGEERTFTTTGTAQSSVQVTLKVDVSAYAATVPLGVNGLRVGGNFADFGAKRGDSSIVNWSPSNFNSRMDSLGNNIWSITITYPASSSGSTQLFKFVNNDWGTNEGTDGNCTIGSYGCGTNDNDRNRILVIPFANKELCYIWDACTACGTTVSLASASTANATDITDSSASVQGTVSGLAIGSRGICYSTFPNPTESNSSVYAAANGEGSYTLTLPDLLPATMYYARTFAKNSAGTSYGNEIVFTTSDVTSTSGLSSGSKNIRVVPNPASEKVSFAGLEQAGELIVRSIQGQEVWRGQVQPGQQIDLSGLRSGGYFYSIRTSGTVYSGKLIRQ